jgi:hypothetical protein
MLTSRKREVGLCARCIDLGSTVRMNRPIRHSAPDGHIVTSKCPGSGDRTAEETVNEPIYRWECTICDASGVAESSEMARLTVTAHVAVAHPANPPNPHLTEPGSQQAT